MLSKDVEGSNSGLTENKQTEKSMQQVQEIPHPFSFIFPPPDAAPVQVN